jgi:hypothetical protein
LYVAKVGDEMNNEKGILKRKLQKQKLPPKRELLSVGGFRLTLQSDNFDLIISTTQINYCP